MINNNLNIYAKKIDNTKKRKRCWSNLLEDLGFGQIKLANDVTEGEDGRR